MIVIKARTYETIEEARTDPVLLVEKEGEGYKLSRLNAGKGDPLVIKAEDIEPWDRKLFYWSAYGDGFIEAANYEDSRDYDAFMKARFGCPEGVTFVAARGGNDELAIVTFVPTYTELPYKLHGYGPSIEAVELVIPGYLNSQRAKTNKAKRDLLERINPMAVMAEMEKQIDLLSALVISLAEKQPEDEQPEWLPRLKEVVEQQGSTQFKGALGSLEDILERKQSLRNIQRDYFQQRGY